MYENVSEMIGTPIWRKVPTFKPQGWHVDYSDLDGESKTVGLKTRKVAEEIALESNGLFYLCDCPNRDCLF